MARLIEIEWPDFAGPASFPVSSLEDCERRIDLTREAMACHGLTHLVVYGDREHLANLTWLTGFDPRFEEALFILRPSGSPLIVVGTECESYLPISPLWKAGKMRHERYEPFSLLDIARDHSRSLDVILKGEGIDASSHVGCVGWKYYASETALDAPSYIVDALRGLTSQVANSTVIFQHAGNGLRTFCSTTEIAAFEYANVAASNGMRQMIEAIREGMTDYELASHMGFNGMPLGCHWTLKTGPNRISLASASGSIIELGQPLSANISYQGANCCRAGWIASDEREAPAGYVANFAGPYFDAMGQWFSMLRLGACGGEIDAKMRELLPDEPFHVKLNPGHLIHLDEWMSSPFYPGSTIELHSGMAIQSDVIPSHPKYFSTRMEDTFVLVDQELKSKLWKEYPGCLARCEARRDFMRMTLGFNLADEVLPLTNLPGIVSPYLLAPRMVLSH